MELVEPDPDMTNTSGRSKACKPVHRHVLKVGDLHPDLRGVWNPSGHLLQHQCACHRVCGVVRGLAKEVEDLEAWATWA